MNRSIAMAALVAALAACSGEPTGERDNSGQRRAEGEVLGGTISDAMVPLESVRSQSPSLRAIEQTGDGGEGEGEGEGDAQADEAADPSAPVAQPQAEAADEAEDLAQP